MRKVTRSNELGCGITQVAGAGLTCLVNGHSARSCLSTDMVHNQLLFGFEETNRFQDSLNYNH